MELKMIKGGYVASEAGGLETVSGQDERIQRIMCRLAARRGGFFPMPDFGSRLHTLSALKPSARDAAARQYIHEALESEEGVEIISVECTDGEGDSLVIGLELSIGGNSTELSFTV